ncbi:MAG TPA: phage portal protein [Pirellulales bacterium]|nr:phage portal protein [Pirellulales bacterium]
MSRSIQPTLDRLEKRLLEAYDDLWDSFVDPREPYSDDGQWWLPLAENGATGGSPLLGPANEAQLAEIRRQCRLLALENEFAINGHENRISYIVGSGHSYRATGRKFIPDPPTGHTEQTLTTLIAQVQSVIDQFIFSNHWHQRQQEIVRRRDRDGEALLRFFTDPDGSLCLRFVEPDQVFTPPDQVVNPAARLGILTDRHDVETVLGYFIDGQLVAAADIQHRKANVDANVRRGLPLFYPVRKNLRRAEKLLRNMSVVAEIQSAIALIRKHRQGTATGVQQFVTNQADVTMTSPNTGRTSTFRRYGPGTILDANANIDYDFPASNVDAANFVTVLQAELRAVASRLVMPEFMLTSDASNANYSSTMMAEGPAMRMFARLQAEQVIDDLEVMWRAVNAAIDAGNLPAETENLVDILAVPPSLVVRDQLQEAQRFRIENAAGILSPQTWCQRDGLDYDQEQANFAAHKRHANQV